MGLHNRLEGTAGGASYNEANSGGTAPWPGSIDLVIPAPGDSTPFGHSWWMHPTFRALPRKVLRMIFNIAAQPYGNARYKLTVSTYLGGDYDDTVITDHTHFDLAFPDAAHMYDIADMDITVPVAAGLALGHDYIEVELQREDTTRQDPLDALTMDFTHLRTLDATEIAAAIVAGTVQAWV